MLAFALSYTLTTCLMEGWSAWVHRVVWHGPLWPLHRSHHRREGLPRPAASARSLRAASASAVPRRWEANDALVVVHAGAAIALMMYGLRHEPGLARSLALGVSGGMTTFGLAYALVHDGIAHRRLSFLPASVQRPWRRMVAAHRVHHASGGPPYGFFLSPWLLARAARRRRVRRPGGSRP